MATRLAIIGAGPLGLEAALRGAARGWEVAVYERGQVGEHLRRWGHVRFFSPFSDNLSKLAREAIAAAPPPEALLTGNEFVEQALLPLARSPQLAGKVHEGVEVLQVGRRRLIKPELPGHPLRAERVFQLLLRERDGRERVAEADVVFDASGVFGTPNAAGESGLPCPGEAACAERIHRHIPDLLGAERADFEGKRVLVVGHGHSAATAITQLGQLREAAPGTAVTWVVTTDRSRPCEEVASDPLPGRRAMVEPANQMAQQAAPGFTVVRRSSLLSLSQNTDGRLSAVVGRAPSVQTVQVDRVLALTGYRPDSRIHRELQVQLSPVTEGAGGLASALMNITDCLSPIVVPPEKLESGEPRFFLIGHKSYGRLSTFLLRAGVEQLEVILKRLK